MSWLLRPAPLAPHFRAVPDYQPPPRMRPAAAQIGLWVFMGVMGSLFLLFGLAYVMRITYADWRMMPPVPWQLWLSTALLAAGSIGWQAAAARASNGRRNAALLWGGLALLSALAFIASQLAAWRVLAQAGHVVAAHPGSSFFYLLTAMHGLHLLGGVLAAVWLLWRLRHGPAQYAAQALGLCAQYWHLLLLLWLYLFLLLFALTPQLVVELCRSVGITLR
jgi:cytochrome c oxidase subunit 3